MELAHILEIEFQELRLEKLDYFIATSGFQSRCSFLAEKLITTKAEKYLLSIDEQDNEPARIKNRNLFLELGFKSINASVKQTTAIEDLLKQICNHKACDSINILIDYSCMPKNWYSVMIDSITRNDFKAEKINLFLSYTPKKFEKVPQSHPVDYLGPILYNKDSLRDGKPVALIAGLDNSYESMSELVKQIKPHKILAFIPDCQHDPEYTNAVMQQNRPLLDRLDKNSIISYSADDPEKINSVLTSLCLDLRLDSEVMIVPQGPKPFSMVSLLLSIRYPDVKLWEIIGKSRKLIPDEGSAAGNPVILKAIFCSDDDYLDPEDN